MVENVPNNIFGLTDVDVFQAVKLRLLANGIKVGTNFAHQLYVRVGVLSDSNAFDLHVVLVKFSSAYGVDKEVAGFTFRPSQGAYGSLGTARSKQFILEALNEKLDAFLLDYLESNIE